MDLKDKAPNKSLGDLTGRVAIITGDRRGMGKSHALAVVIDGGWLAG